MTDPYLAGSNFWVEMVAASDLDALSTSRHAVAVVVAAAADDVPVAVADM